MDLESYIETALWASIDNDDEPMDSNYYMRDLTDEFLKQSQLECDEFLDNARHLFTDNELENSTIEHDFWLTRNHHGAGFWDGDYERGDEITKIAQEFTEVDLMEYLK